MCGIVGYAGSRPCRDVLLDGLETLGYRGYDSAGLAMAEDGEVAYVRAVGTLSTVRERVGDAKTRAVSGIGHTRWATHGAVSEQNCNPHADTAGRVYVVVNGIIENWACLKTRLSEEGARFISETDAEVVAHLIASNYGRDLVEAVCRAHAELRGHYAFVALSADEPELLVGARKECPLVVGVGKRENFIASEIPAFMSATRRIQLVENEEVVAVTPRATRFLGPRGEPVEREIREAE